MAYLNAESADMPKYLRVSCGKANVPLPRRRGKKPMDPSFQYGNSYEIPTYFQTNGGIKHGESYKNPFVLDPKTYAQISPDKTPFKSILHQIHKNEIMGTKLRQLQTFSISPTSKPKIKETEPPSTVLKMFNIATNREWAVSKQERNKSMPDEEINFSILHNETISHSKKPFHRKHGLFTDFIDRNAKLSIYGSICSRDRPSTSLGKATVSKGKPSPIIELPEESSRAIPPREAETDWRLSPKQVATIAMRPTRPQTGRNPLYVKSIQSGFNGDIQDIYQLSGYTTTAGFRTTGLPSRQQKKRPMSNTTAATSYLHNQQQASNPSGRGRTIDTEVSIDNKIIIEMLREEIKTRSTSRRKRPKIKSPAEVRVSNSTIQTMGDLEAFERLVQTSQLKKYKPHQIHQPVDDEDDD